MHPNASAAPLNAVAAPVGPLDWRRVVGWLREDGVISPEEAERTIARCAQAESHQHPLVRLANVAMERAADARALDLEELTQYVAGRCGLPYLRIDPLKVDVGRVADAMSASYAERHRVLPVQVTPHEVVVATAEPFITDWVAEVERQSKRSVRRVMANPQDITRYMGEFFALAKSVRAAQKAGGASSGSTFEQLVELGKTNKQLDANDQGVVRVVDWLWQYAFDQRASDIHLEPRRDQGVIRFRIDGVLHPRVPNAHGRAQCHGGAREAARAHGRGGAPSSARWPYQNPQPARRRGGNALVHLAHGVWRKDGDADF